MGFKSILGKIGKIGLMAAPYVAAPFTGGLSLGATGLANQAVAKWSAHDAKVAESKGLAPSNFDKILNKVGTVSNIASAAIPTSALGKVGMLGKGLEKGSKVAKTASILGKVKKSVDVATPLIGAAVNSNNGNRNEYQEELNPGIGPSNPPIMNLPAPTPQYNTEDAIARGRARARQY